MILRFTALSVLVLLSGAAHAIDICSGGDRAARKLSCLVDGDTGWHIGEKWRLLNIDTPEYAPHAECQAETVIAKRSTNRMRELLRGGYRIQPSGDADRNGRDLVRIKLADGRDAGAVLLDEGLAVTWPHEPGVWCR